MAIVEMVLNPDMKETKQEWVEVDTDTGEITRYPSISSSLMRNWKDHYYVPNTVKKWVYVSKDKYLGHFPSVHSYSAPYTLSPYCAGKEKFTSCVPKCANSINQLNLSLDWVDKRSIHSENNTKYLMDMSCGAKERGDLGVPKINKSQYKVLERIGSNLTWYNFIHTDSKSLAKILNCSPSNIKNTLKSVEGIIKYENVKKGEWRVFINPAYAFKYSKAYFKEARESAIFSWLFSKEQYPYKDIPKNNSFVVHPKGCNFSYEGLESDMNDIDYLLEFGKERQEPWPEVTNNSSQFLPEHLQQGCTKKFVPRELL